VPGDGIVGLVMTGRGITIHRDDCQNLKNFSQETHQILELSWEENVSEEEKFVSRIMIEALNKPESLTHVTAMIGKNSLNIKNIKIQSRKENLVVFMIDLEVSHKSQLLSLMANLRATPMIQRIERLSH
jgi:GTP pyrophosphokinase